MGLSVSDKRIKIKVCPNKFIVGNNVQDAPVNLVYSTLYDLSNVLGLDLGFVYSGRIRCNPYCIYRLYSRNVLPLFMQPKNILRYGMGTSLYYEANSSKVKKVFYDKVKEVDKEKLGVKDKQYLHT